MKKRTFIHAPLLVASLSFGAALFCTGCNAQTPVAGASTQAALSPVVADVVRVFPRAGFAAQMVGGEIQGSNESATGGFVTLAKITTAPREGQWTRVPLNNVKPYRFLRYFGPSGSYSAVAELEFLSGDKKITGTPYGTFGSRDNSGNDYQKAFDGDTKTYFDAVAPNAQYLGIEIKSGDAQSSLAGSVVVGNGLRHYHIGNSLTDTIGDYTKQIAIAAGYRDDFAERQTIPGAPLHFNYNHKSGFGMPYPEAFEKLAPLSDLVLQTFISNGDSPDPEFSLKFYEDARVKSPDIRPWIYGQWDSTGSGSKDSGSPDWEARNIKLMRIYMAHAANFNAATKGRKTEVIPGGLALNNLKQAVEAGKVPGMTNFFAANFEDDLHVNMNGRYFIGLVTFSSLYRQSPVGLPIVKINDNPPTLTPEQNKLYQQVAWDTVQSFRKDGGASLGLAVPGELDARINAMSDMPIQGSRLQYISEKASFLYVLNVPKAGKYDLKVSAYADKPDERLEIFINNTAAGAVTIKKDDKQPLADTEALSVDLKAGFNLLRLYVPTNRPYDLNSIKISAAGQTLKNTMPVFDFSVWDEELKPGETTFVRDFNIRDGETSAEKLLLSATSDTAELVPDGAIKIESGEFKGQWGNVYNRRLTVTPLAGQKGRAVITVSATDADGSKRQQSFKLKVQ